MLLVEIEALGPNGVETLRWATDEGYINEENQVYEPRVIQAGNFERHLFRRGQTLGPSQIGFGEIEINNADGALDFLFNYAFDARPFTIKRAENNTLILKGAVGGVEFFRRSIRFRIRDSQALIAEQLVVRDVFEGNNVLPDGFEGLQADWRGKNKPQPFGIVRLAPIPLVNTSRSIFQIANRASQAIAITAVQDGGSAITASSNYANLADVQATAPAGAQFRFFPGSATQGAYLRAGSPPQRLYTADILEGNTPADRTVAQIMRRIAIIGGASPSNIRGVETVDSLAGWATGFYVAADSGTTVGAALDALASSVHGYWIGQRDGSVRFGLLRAPLGSPKTTFNEWTILEDGTAIERIASQNEGLPYWRITVEYQRNWSVQTRENLAGIALSEQERLSQEYRKVVVTNDAVKARHPLAGEMTVTTLLDNVADATTLANELLLMYGQQRDVFEIAVDAEYSENVDLDDVVELTLPRFGMENGRLFRVIGITENLSSRRATLTLWG